MGFLLFLAKRLWLLFPAVYLSFAVYFLNILYKQDSLFPTGSRSGKYIYFVTDIFDMFWLVVAAIPNTLFAGAYFSKIYAAYTEERYPTILFAVVIPLAVAIIWRTFIASATDAFSRHENVWSNNLPSNAFLIYQLFEIISATALVTEGSCLVFHLVCAGAAFELGEVTACLELLPYALATSIILFLYWIMLVLSNISNRKYFYDPVQQKNLFPNGYGQLGSLALLVVTVSVYLFCTVYLKSSTNLPPSLLITIIGSVILPGAAIIVQVIQLFK